MNTFSVKNVRGLVIGHSHTYQHALDVVDH